MITTVAIIGCGRISENAHFPALQKMDNVRIKYACDLIADKAQDKVERFGAEIAITDYRTALQDKEVDAVFVLTPNASHKQITLDALNAGKHVFCEKPIAVCYEDACQMAALAEKKGLHLSIGVCNRFNKSVVEIRDLVQSGKLGDVYTVYCSFRANRSIPGLGGAFTSKAESGGGVLIDWGVHFLDIILFVLGDTKIQTVSAATYNKLGRDIPAYKFKDMWAGPPVLDGVNDVEEYVTGFIRTNKASISFNGAWAQNIAEKDPMHIDFMGDKAGVRLIYGKNYSVFDNDLNSTFTEGKLPNHYETEDEVFIRTVREGGSTVADISRILESQKLLDIIYRSAAENREIKVEE